MYTRVFQPSSSLRPYVQYFFGYRLERQEARRLYPNGIVVLPNTYGRLGIFFGAPTNQQVSADSYEPNPIVGVSSFYTRPRSYLVEGAVEMLIVGFTPVGLQAFLPISAGEVVNSNLAVGDLISGFSDRLQSALAKPTSWSERVRAVERELSGYLLSCSPDDQVAGVLVPLICRSQGKISIRQLSKELWVSERTLRRRFRQAVGISPKVYCQLVRFQSGLQLLKQNRKLSLAGMALELGYYDQAHWGHDFLGLAGCTPGEWQQKKRSVLSNYYADHQGRITGQPVAYV